MTLPRCARMTRPDYLLFRRGVFLYNPIRESARQSLGKWDRSRFPALIPFNAGRWRKEVDSDPFSWRKVRAPQGRVPGNAWEARAYGKCHRKYTADATGAGKGEMVR